MGSSGVVTGEVSLCFGSSLREEVVVGFNWLIGVNIVEGVSRLLDCWLEIPYVAQRLLLSLEENRSGWLVFGVGQDFGEIFGVDDGQHSEVRRFRRNLGELDGKRGWVRKILRGITPFPSWVGFLRCDPSPLAPQFSTSSEHSCLVLDGVNGGGRLARKVDFGLDIFDLYCAKDF